MPTPEMPHSTDTLNAKVVAKVTDLVTALSPSLSPAPCSEHTLPRSAACRPSGQPAVHGRRPLRALAWTLACLGAGLIHTAQAQQPPLPEADASTGPAATRSLPPLPPLPQALPQPLPQVPATTRWTPPASAQAARPDRSTAAPSPMGAQLAPSTAGQLALNAAAAKSLKEHEAQLALIRQAILEATAEQPTRVLSTAWVDEQGALHESAHFHSQAQVRGVRVLSYVQGDEPPQTRVSAEVLPWGWRHSAGQSCNAQSQMPRPWRLPLLVQTRLEPGFSGPQQFASQALLELAHQAWAGQMQQSQRWRTQDLVLPPDNAYLRALSGSGQARSGWAAEMRLRPHAPAPASNAVADWASRWSKAPESWRWTLSLTLGERATPEAAITPQWRIEQTVVIDAADVSRQPGAWLQQLQTDLAQRMGEWVQQLDERSACEPIQFHVRRQGNENMQLQAGHGSGLRPGDRVLLIDPVHLPSRMLEAGMAQHLALAQVVRVGAQHTELQQLAGPALPTQGQWMALPL